eukprot:scaffold106652_cov61-Phaeocystis_antarctica.AAC.1
MLAVPAENHSAASRNLGHRLYRTVLLRRVASLLFPTLIPLLSHTHTAYAAVTRDTAAAAAVAPSTASSIRHRRLRHRPSRGRGAYQAGARRGLCAGAGSIVTDVSGGKQSKEPACRCMLRRKLSSAVSLRCVCVDARARAAARAAEIDKIRSRVARVPHCQRQPPERRLRQQPLVDLGAPTRRDARAVALHAQLHAPRE